MLLTVNNFYQTVCGAKGSKRLVKENEGRRDLALSKEAIEAQLGRLRKSAHFRTSRRLFDFLSFITRESIAGRADQLQAYTIATAVFGRPADFDPANDSIVRVQARQLRMKLDAYFASTGSTEEMVISVPKGGYAPKFEWRSKSLATNDKAGRLAVAAQRPMSVARRIMISLPPHLGERPKLANFCTKLRFELVQSLSQYKELAVVSPETASTDTELTRTADTPPADYALKCTVSVEQSHTLLLFEMVRLADRLIVWSDKSAPLEDHEPYSDPRRLAQEITVALVGPTGCVTIQDFRDLDRLEPSISPNYRAILVACDYLGNPSRAGHFTIHQQLLDVLEHDPKDANVWAMLAMTYVHMHSYGYAIPDSHQSPLTSAKKAARRAISLDESNASGWHQLSMVAYEERRFQEFQRYGARAVALNETHSQIAVDYGHHLWQCGRRDEGMELIKDALGLHSIAPSRFLFAYAHDHIQNARYDEASDLVDQIVMPDFFWLNVLKASLCGQLGNHEKARLEADKANELFPGIIPAIATQRIGWNFPEVFARNLKAGITSISKR